MSHNEVPLLDDETYTEASFPANCSDFPLEKLSTSAELVLHNLAPRPAIRIAPSPSVHLRGSQDSGYESACSSRESGHGGLHAGSADISKYFSASVRPLRKSSDIPPMAGVRQPTSRSLRPHSDIALVPNVRTVQGEEIKEVNK